MGKELEIANKINHELNGLLFLEKPDRPDRPLVCEVFNKHNPNIRMENNNQSWYEEDEFYELFEKICNDNITNHVDESEVLENLKVPIYNLDYLPDRILNILIKNKYVATREIIKRELYLFYYKSILLDLDKDEQIIRIVRELEKLIGE